MKNSVIHENLNLGVHLARAGDLDLLPHPHLALKWKAKKTQLPVAFGFDICVFALLFSFFFEGCERARAF
jgi:hypothetical protein